MIVYQTRYEDGVFVGITHADPNPLEEGQWLIPGGCVTTAPPPFTSGRARWANNAWVLETDALSPDFTMAWDGQKVTLTETPPEPAAPPPDLTPAQKLALVGLTVADLKALLA
jgi:hypothetical protein